MNCESCGVSSSEGKFIVSDVVNTITVSMKDEVKIESVRMFDKLKLDLSVSAENSISFKCNKCLLNSFFIILG